MSCSGISQGRLQGVAVKRHEPAVVTYGLSYMFGVVHTGGCGSEVVDGMFPLLNTVTYFAVLSRTVSVFSVVASMLLGILSECGFSSAAGEPRSDVGQQL